MWRSESATMPILICSPGHSICSGRLHVRRYLWTWKNLHRLRVILRVFLSSSFLDIALFPYIYTKKMRITLWECDPPVYGWPKELAIQRFRCRCKCQRCGLYDGGNGKSTWPEYLWVLKISAGTSSNKRDAGWGACGTGSLEWKTPIYQKSQVNYSELLQLAKGWGNFVFGRSIIWRLPCWSPANPNSMTFWSFSTGDEKDHPPSSAPSMIPMAGMISLAVTTVLFRKQSWTASSMMHIRSTSSQWIRRITNPCGKYMD